MIKTILLSAIAMNAILDWRSSRSKKFKQVSDEVVILLLQVSLSPRADWTNGVQMTSGFRKEYAC
jgi:hypothetical protein